MKEFLNVPINMDELEQVCKNSTKGQLIRYMKAHIAAACSKEGWSQWKIAGLLNVSQPTIGSYIQSAKVNDEEKTNEYT